MTVLLVRTVFPAAIGFVFLPHHSGLENTAGLATEETIQGKQRELMRYRPTVRIHDLSHTFASHLVSLGESLGRVGRLLGHTSPATTARMRILTALT